MSTPPDFQQALQQMRADYARQVPLRLQEAQGFLQACLAQPADEAALRDLYRIVHKLAGSAGTFGLREFGVAARALEEKLDLLLAQPERTPADFAPLAAELAQLGGHLKPA